MEYRKVLRSTGEYPYLNAFVWRSIAGDAAASLIFQVLPSQFVVLDFQLKIFNLQDVRALIHLIV